MLEAAAVPRLLRALEHLRATAGRLRDDCAGRLAALCAGAADAGAPAPAAALRAPEDAALCAVCDALAGACVGAGAVLAHEAARARDACAACLRALDADVGAADACLADLRAGAGAGAARRATALQALQALARATAAGQRLRDAVGAVAAVQAAQRARVADVWRAGERVAQRVCSEAARREDARSIVRDVGALRAVLAALLADAGAGAGAAALLARVDAAAAQVDALLAPVHVQQEARARVRALEQEVAACRARLDDAARVLRGIAAAAGVGTEAEEDETAEATRARVEQLRALCETQQADLGAVVEQLVQTARRYRDADAQVQRLEGQCAALRDENAQLRESVDAAGDLKRTNEDLVRANAALTARVRKLTAQLQAQQAQQPQQAQPETDMPRIERVGPFHWGQTAVFVLQPVGVGVYEAANVGHPHFFLHDSSVHAIAQHSPPTVVARLICEPEAHTAAASNPYRLRAGEPYWLCLCERVAHE